MRLRPFTWLTMLCLLATSAACPFLFGDGDDGSDPCDADPAGCGPGDEFMLDPSCTLEGDLQVELGQGEHDYTPLAPGEAPELHHGPQGGSHVWLGVRVANHARDYPSLEIQLELLYSASACDTDCEWLTAEERTVVVGEDQLELTPDGGAQVAGITVFADGWGESSSGALRATVRDPCGREGMLLHENSG